jgi:hypothetical protein
MTNRALLALLSGLATSTVIGCGTTVVDAPAPATDPAVEAPAAPPVATEPPAPELDHGAPSTTYPAFAPAMGQLRNHGGGVLKNPVIVTVTWDSDDKASELETLGDTIGAGQYWHEVASEYGSGPAVSGDANHVRITDAPPATITDTQLSALVAASLTKDEAPWPVPAGDAVYILYLPSTTQLMLQGKSACAQGVGGYHDSTSVNGKPTAFAIVPRCGSSFDHVTVAASHELAEAATDPYPRTRPAWSGFRDDDLAWEFFQQFQSENGDACEFYRDSDLAPGESDVAFTVQRQWSNASARAGHDPCVPAFANTKYFNVTPLGLEDIDVDLSSLGGGEGTTKGFKVKVGETRQLPLGFYSDGPLGDWTIKAINGGIAGGRSSGGVDLTLDVTSGQNGHKAYLTVTVNTAGKTNTELVTIVSTRAGTSHYMPLLIGN